MSFATILENKREEILKIASAHGAANIRVFGSVAHGEDGPDSDIDFLVDMEDDHSPFFPGGLIADLEDLLGHKVDVVTKNGLHKHIRDKVLSDAVIL